MYPQAVISKKLSNSITQESNVPTYEVVVRATITKTYTITAPTRDEAISLAHEQFSVLNDDVPEHYEEDCLVVTKIEE